MKHAVFWDNQADEIWIAYKHGKHWLFCDIYGFDEVFSLEHLDFWSFL